MKNHSEAEAVTSCMSRSPRTPPWGKNFAHDPAQILDLLACDLHLVRSVRVIDVQRTENRSAVEQKIDFFAACMDEKAVNEAGTKPLRPVLQETRR
jgi:hypothetical protein